MQRLQIGEVAESGFWRVSIAILEAKIVLCCVQKGGSPKQGGHLGFLRNKQTGNIRQSEPNKELACEGATRTW